MGICPEGPTGEKGEPGPPGCGPCGRRPNCFGDRCREEKVSPKGEIALKVSRIGVSVGRSPTNDRRHRQLTGDQPD